MSEPKKPSLPNIPTFQADPNVSGNIGILSDIGRNLTSGNIPGFLQPLVSLNPAATQTAIGLATRDVETIRNRAQQSIINQLEANNQLTSSVAVNRLSDLNQDFSRDISDIVSQFYLADVNRALSNTASLFGAGLDATGNAAQLGLANQGQVNQFNLENYSNAVAKSQSEQQSGRGGLFGGLLGTAAGLALAPFTGGSSLALAGLGGALGSGIGELISPSATGSAATAFGTSAISSLGQLNLINSLTGIGLGGTTPTNFQTGVAGPYDLNNFSRFGSGAFAF